MSDNKPFIPDTTNSVLVGQLCERLEKVTKQRDEYKAEAIKWFKKWQACEGGKNGTH